MTKYSTAPALLYAVHSLDIAEIQMPRLIERCLQLAGLQAEINQKVVSLPAAPGRLHINVAATMHGIMVSPACLNSLYVRSVIVGRYCCPVLWGIASQALMGTCNPKTRRGPGPQSSDKFCPCRGKGYLIGA